MIQGIRKCCLAIWVVALCLSVSSLYTENAIGSEVASKPEMPEYWVVVSDFLVPVEQVKSLSSKLGTSLSSVRNTLYDVNGKHVQVNVIVTPDLENAEKLMTKLRSMKAEEALLQKGLIIYEFVGQNDVFPLIVEGRKYLDSK